MHKQKGTQNTPQSIIDVIMEKHRSGSSVKELAEEYGKPYKTVKNVITRENNKKRREEAGFSLA